MKVVELNMHNTSISALKKVNNARVRIRPPAQSFNIKLESRIFYDDIAVKNVIYFTKKNLL